MWQLVVLRVDGVHRNIEPNRAVDDAGHHHVGRGRQRQGFCGSAKKDLKDLQAENSSLFAGGATPDAIKKEFSNLQSAYAHAQSQAPAEIQPDLAVIIGFIGKLNNVLASDNYNLQAAAPQLESLAASTKLKQAGAPSEGLGRDELRGVGGAGKGPLVSFAAPLRGRLMVGRLTLDQVVGVRVPAPQPCSRVTRPLHPRRLTAHDPP